MFYVLYVPSFTKWDIIGKEYQGLEVIYGWHKIIKVANSIFEGSAARANLFSYGVYIYVVTEHIESGNQFSSRGRIRQSVSSRGRIRQSGSSLCLLSASYLYSG